LELVNRRLMCTMGDCRAQAKLTRDGVSTTLAKMMNQIRDIMPTFRITNSKNNPVQLLQTLFLLNVSVRIGNDELGNPVGAKSAGAKSSNVKVVSRINGYNDDYCFVMPSSAESVAFEMMVEEPTKKDMASDQRAKGHSCNCKAVVNNRGQAIIPSLATAIQKESDKFMNNFGVCHFKKRFMVPKEEFEAFTSCESFILIVGLPIHVIVVVKSIDMHGATKHLIMDPFSPYSLISAGQFRLEYNVACKKDGGKKASAKAKAELFKMTMNWDHEQDREKVKAYFDVFDVKPTDKYQRDANLKHPDVVKALGWSKNFSGYQSTNIVRQLTSQTCYMAFVSVLKIATGQSPYVNPARLNQMICEIISTSEFGELLGNGRFEC